MDVYMYCVCAYEWLRANMWVLETKSRCLTAELSTSLPPSFFFLFLIKSLARSAHIDLPEINLILCTQIKQLKAISNSTSIVIQSLWTHTHTSLQT